MGKARYRFLALGLASPLLTLAQVSAAQTAEGGDGDVVDGTRSQALVESKHEVDVWLDQDHAKLVVRRTLYNGGDRPDQAYFNINVPETAVAVRLRTLGELNGKPHWFDGDLLEAEEAAAKYQALTGFGGAYPKDPALLSWRGVGHLALQVFPCMPKAHKTVEYTLLLPTDYEAGRHEFSLSQMGRSGHEAWATVRTGGPGDQLYLDGNPIPSGTRIRLDQDRKLSLLPKSPPSIRGMLATAEYEPGSAVSRWRVDLAEKLTSVPKNPRIVVVVDTSRSFGEAGIDAAHAALRAYLAHFPEAQVEVVEFDRKTRRRFGGFVPPQTVIADSERRPVSLNNGSNADDALALAAQLVTGYAGPSRILVMSDAQMRNSFAARALEKVAARTRAIVHLATVETGSGQVERDDSHEWAAAARRTGGLFWSARASLAPEEAEEMKRVYEEWARPVRLDHVDFQAQGVVSVDGEIPESLAEGSTLRKLQMGSPVQWISLKGELWSQPYQAKWTPDSAETKRWSALIFGQSERDTLSEAQMMVLARRGRAVSPVTSYLAIEPGVRPSTEGLTDDEFGQGLGGGGVGMGVGLGSIGTLGHGRGNTWDPRRQLEELLAPAWKACGGKLDTATLELETTAEEVVDVPSVRINPPDPGLQACLREAVWDLTLDQSFASHPRGSFELHL